MPEYTVVIKKAYVKTFSYRVTADNSDDAYDIAKDETKEAFENCAFPDRNPDFDEITVVE
jgi:hypothetical protein